MKQNYFCIFLLIVVTNTNVLSQKHDFMWLLGYSFADNPHDTGFGSSFIDFNTENGNPIFYESKYKKIDFNLTSANICDKDGNYLFSCNGVFIEGPTDELMENSDRLDGENKYPDLGQTLSQGVTILPRPKSDQEYYVFHKSQIYLQSLKILTSPDLFLTKVDMSQKNGVGIVTSRRNLLMRDTLDDGCLTAVKHANGRDWWLIVSSEIRIKYFVFLVEPERITFSSVQEFQGGKNSESGFSFFSNDGKYFVSALNDNELSKYNIHFFNFDRCEGKLYNYQHFKLPYYEGLGPGCSFSPDNKYLYASTIDHLYQFEIVHDSLKNRTTIAEYDGYREYHPPNWMIPTRFGQLQQAPDGRIYGQENFNAFNALHVINQPNKKGKSCDFVQHGVLTPTPKGCVPNYPNYRLGPIDGSLCDTLGIDNMPWAHWRYDQDTTDFLNFNFFDLSAYEVEQWCWDFGDPESNSNTSAEKDPVHRFTKNGIYTVCLIVKNKNGSDTLCRIVKIGNVVDTYQPDESNIKIQVWPNPCKELLVVNVIDYNPEHMEVNLFNQFGKNINRFRLFQGSNFIDMNPYGTGIYYLKIVEQEKLYHVERIVKL